MLKRLFLNSFIYGLGPQVPKVIGFFVLPFITEFLTDIDYGIHGTIMSYSAFLGAFSILGFGVILVNTYVKHPDRYIIIWRQIYGFLILWTIVYAFLQFLILYVLMPDEVGDNKYLILFLLIFPVLFFGPVSNVALFYYQLEEKPLPITIRTILTSLITIFFNVVFIRFYKMGYMGWFYATFIGTLFWNFSCWYSLMKLGIKPIFNFKRRLIIQYLKISLPTIFHSYGSFLIGSSNKIIMDRYNVNIGLIGKYNFAEKIYGYADLSSFAINKALSPIIMKEYRQKNEVRVLYLIRIVQVLVLAGTFGIATFSKELVDFLMRNQTLKDSYYLVIILVMIVNHKPMYMASTSVLFFTEKTKELWKVSFIGGLLTVLIYLIVTPIYGIYGVAIGYFIGITYLSYRGFLLKEFKTFSKVNYRPVESLLTTILMTLIVFFIVDQDIMIKISVYILTLLLLFILILNFIKKQK